MEVKLEKKNKNKTNAEVVEDCLDKIALNDIIGALSGIAEKELESNGRSMYFMRILQTKRFAEEAVKLLN